MAGILFTSKDLTPELALREMYKKANVHSRLQVALADKHILKVDTLSTVGETLTDFKTNVRVIVGDAILGSNMGEREANLTMLGSAWKKAVKLQDLRDGQRARIEEDPSLIPQIGGQDFWDMRADFLRNHDQLVINTFKEPNKKFVERMQRDYMVDEMLKFYELGRIRLASETIETSSGLASTPQHLMRMAKEEIDAVVCREEDALNRIFALYMAMDMLGYCAMTPHVLVKDAQGNVTSTTGGPLTYLKELEKHRHSNPGLRFLTIYDRKIRMQIFELQCEDRVTYDDYSYTLYIVLKDYKHLLQEARNECSVPVIDVSNVFQEPSSSSAPTVVHVPAVLTPRAAKQKFVDQNGNPVSAKRAKQILGGKGGGKQPKQPTVVQTQPGSGQAGSQGSGAPGERKKIPEKEYRALTQALKTHKANKICMYWNSTLGCSNPKCSRKHDVCLECGGSHRWVDVHYRG